MTLGRFIPMGRSATDLLAGQTPLPGRGFLRISGLAAVGYAVYCIGLAALAGPFAAQHPLAVTVGVVILSIVAGLVIARVDDRLQARRDSQHVQRRIGG
jgi:membrane protein DedA with SNARE-associated domain